MKRTVCLKLLSFALVISAASAAQACCLFPLQLLNPFAWGCGYGMGPGFGGCGYPGPMGYGGYGYAPQMYAPTYAPMYGPAPMQPGCDCVGYAPQQQLSAVQVPVTTYRPVTQYVPQTSYQTQYQWNQPSMAYGSTLSAPLSYSTPTYHAPAISSGYAPSYSMPQSVPQFASPVTGDITGDHEFPATSQLMPVPQTTYHVGTQVRQASYRSTPQVTHRYSQSVR